MTSATPSSQPNTCAPKFRRRQQDRISLLGEEVVGILFLVEHRVRCSRGSEALGLEGIKLRLQTNNKSVSNCKPTMNPKSSHALPRHAQLDQK